MKYLNALLLLVIHLSSGPSFAETLNVGDGAPLFAAQTESGAPFVMADRKGHWTVLYFYPKAETPGCTKQACAFRDNIKIISQAGAEIFGISADTVEQLAAFHQAHHLNFTLLADPESKVIRQYGTKMPILKLSKRWTFIVDPELKIRDIDRDIDPAKDADRVARRIQELKAEHP